VVRGRVSLVCPWLCPTVVTARALVFVFFAENGDACTTFFI
jgi:hypothetical protein